MKRHLLTTLSKRCPDDNNWYGIIAFEWLIDTLVSALLHFALFP